MRQHDLRTSHSCTSGTCPAPLVELPHELSTIALSPLTPYQFVVGGESPYVRVDLRMFPFFIVSLEHYPLSAGFLSLGFHFPLIYLVFTIAIRRRTFSIADIRGVICMKNGVCHLMKGVQRPASGGLGAAHVPRVQKEDLSMSQARGCLPGMGTRYVITLSLDASWLNARTRSCCVRPST